MKNKYSKKLNRLAAVVAVTGTLFYVGTGRAASVSDEDVQTLIKRVNELEQQVKVLQRSREVDQDTAADKAKDAAIVSLGVNGLQVRSGDSNFTMTAHGYVQADARNYLGQKSAATPDTFLLRRVRPIVEGTVWKDINYRVMLDLASGNVNGSTANNQNILDDAYVNVHFWKEAQFQIGKYKSPIGLERLQSTADLMSIETGFATQLTPNYDLGIEVHNDLFNSPIAYAVGIFDGAADGGSEDADIDEGKDAVGRLFFQPFLNKDSFFLQHLGFGAAGSIGTHNGTLASYKSPGQQTIFSYANLTPHGNQYRIDPQAFYFWGPFGIQGEWVLSSQKVSPTTAIAGLPATRFNNTAWQVQASYFLTGEENSFKASSLQHVSPRHRFSLSEGGWGAFELVAEVQHLSLDNDAFRKFGATSLVTGTSARDATSWGVGVNWHLNGNLKVSLNYESTTFTSGTPSAGIATPTPEHVILSRVQFSF